MAISLQKDRALHCKNIVQKIKIDKTIKIKIESYRWSTLYLEYMGQEVSSPLFCLDAGKQDSPQNKYAKKLLPKNLKLFPSTSRKRK